MPKRKGTGAVNKTYKQGGFKAVWKKYLGHVKSARAAVRWAKRRASIAKTPHPFRKAARIYGHRLHHLIVLRKKRHGHRGRGKVLKMQDSVEASALDPSAADAFLYYDDGPFANEAPVKAQTPGKRHLGITTNGSTPLRGEKRAGDCEPGDLTPDEMAALIVDAFHAGEEVVCPYCSISQVLALHEALIAHGVPKGVLDPRVRTISAHYTNVPHLCDGRCWSSVPAGFKAAGTQYHGSMIAADPDLSLIEASALP